MDMKLRAPHPMLQGGRPLVALAILFSQLKLQMSEGREAVAMGFFLLMQYFLY